MSKYNNKIEWLNVNNKLKILKKNQNLHEIESNLWDSNVELNSENGSSSGVFKCSDVGSGSVELLDREYLDFIDKIAFRVVHEVMHTILARIGTILCGKSNYYQPDNIFTNWKIGESLVTPKDNGNLGHCLFLDHNSAITFLKTPSEQSSMFYKNLLMSGPCASALEGGESKDNYDGKYLILHPIHIEVINDAMNFVDIYADNPYSKAVRNNINHQICFLSRIENIQKNTGYVASSYWNKEVTTKENNFRIKKILISFEEPENIFQSISNPLMIRLKLIQVQLLDQIRKSVQQNPPPQSTTNLLMLFFVCCIMFISCGTPPVSNLYTKNQDIGTDTDTNKFLNLSYCQVGDDNLFTDISDGKTYYPGPRYVGFGDTFTPFYNVFLKNDKVVKVNIERNFRLENTIPMDWINVKYTNKEIKHDVLDTLFKFIFKDEQFASLKEVEDSIGILKTNKKYKIRKCDEGYDELFNITVQRWKTEDAMYLKDLRPYYYAKYINHTLGLCKLKIFWFSTRNYTKNSKHYYEIDSEILVHKANFCTYSRFWELI